MTASSLLERLNMRYPIVQAPMAGGGDTPALVAETCDAGALGSVGAAYLTPDQILERGREVRARTDRPFAVNLFATQHYEPAPADPRPAVARVAGYYAELGLTAPAAPAAHADTLEQQIEAVLESGAELFSFTFGIPSAAALAKVKARGMLVVGTATTVDEALALERAGADAVVAQGSEAGGHRGTFGTSFEEGMVGTLALVPQIVDAVKVPVIASGGIMDGRGIAAALALGATAAQLGTAFLVCDEAGVPEVYKAAILATNERSTRITRAFSGRPARGIVNRFMNEVEGDAAPGTILPFPLQNALTRPLRTAAAKAGRAEFLSLWAGQGAHLARRLPAAELVALLARELGAARRE